MTENKADYPTANIISMYTLCGSFTGGILVGLYFAIGLLVTGHASLQELVGSIIGMPFLFGFFGIVFGFIPACLTGIWIAKRRLCYENIISYAKLFFMGFIVSFIFFFVAFLTDGFERFASTFGAMVACGLIGGLSSVMVGYFVLPKINTSIVHNKQ